MQQHDRLAIGNLTALDHRKGVVDVELHQTDLLALLDEAATAMFPSGGIVGRRIEVHTFRHRARAHERVEHVGHLADTVPGFLDSLTTNRRLRIVIVEQPCSRLNEHSVGMPVDIDRVAKLHRQQHCAACNVVQQDGGAIAAIIGLARLGGPRAIRRLIVEGRRVQGVPVVAQQPHVTDANARISCGRVGGPHQRETESRRTRLSAHTAAPMSANPRAITTQ